MKRTIYLFIAALFAFFPAAAQNNLGLSVVAIDPGHGGKDPGAVSSDGKTYEKTLTLDIAKRLSEKIKAGSPGVKVVLTREKDKYVDLNDRAAIANKANADLFISIHINATAKSGPNGYSVHVLGKSSKKDRDLFAYNMDVCKRENSVILLEEDYTTKYQGFDPSDPESFIFMQLVQNAHLEQSLQFAQSVSDHLKGGPIQANRGVWQDPFLVLWKTAMPSVLVELGFISNATDLKALGSETNRDKLASRLYDAFKEYKAAYDRSVTLDVEVEQAGAAADSGKEEKQQEVKQQEKPKEEQKKEEEKTEDHRYGIQIFAGSKYIEPGDKAFMGYAPVIINTGTLYKYIIGIDYTEDGARARLPEIRKQYPDAFPVKFNGNTVTRLK